jgi:hypothetical protein
MKDDLTALLEAVRLVRAELESHKGRTAQAAPRTVARIAAIMDEPRVADAIERLDPAGEAPSITPALPESTRVH